MHPRPHSVKKNLKASCSAVVLMALLSPALINARQERGPTQTSADDLRAAIDRLGDLDYSIRSKAGRVVRRTAPAQAVPALLQAVREHEDGFVRFRSLVLLTGFNDPRAADQMVEVLASPNDRLVNAIPAVAFGLSDLRGTLGDLLLSWVE